MRIEPDDWAAIYESNRPTGQAFVFRRSAEVARNACLARATPGERWVDVGTGTGHLAFELAAVGLDVIAVDNDPTMLRAAEKRSGASADHQPRFRIAEAHRLPFEDGTLDGVVATSLCGCLADPKPFFFEVGRVLRPRGTAVLTFTNRESALHGIGRRLASEQQPSLFLPIRRYSTHEAARELEGAGLLVREIRYYNCFLSTQRMMFPPRRVALLLERGLDNHAGRFIARNFLAVATK